MLRTIVTLSSYLAYGLVCGGIFLVFKRYWPSGRLERLTRGQTALAVALLALYMFAISEPQHALFEDFVEAYYSGGAAVLGGLERAQEMFSRGVHGFVNVPIVAVWFVPFAIFPVGVAKALFTVLGLLTLWALYVLLVRAAELDRRSRIVFGLFLLLNGPLFNSLREGNTSHFALLALALALVWLREGREFLAGLLLGIVAFLKLPLLLFGVWFFVRGRFRAVVGMGSIIFAMLGISVALFGVEAHISWYEQFVAGSSRNPIAAFNVQSIVAFLTRFEQEPGVLCYWEGIQASSIAKGIGTAVVVALYVATILSAVRFPGARTSPSAAVRRAQLDVEFLLVLVLACVTTPLAWSHYYAWMLMPIAFLLAPRENYLETHATRRIFWIAAVLVSLPVVWPLFCAPPSWLTPVYLVLMTHYLFGGILLLALLIRWRWRLREPLEST